MADPETNLHDGNIAGIVLVLGSSASGKEMKWLLTLCLESLKAHTGYQLSSFPKSERLKLILVLKVELYNTRDEYDLKKTFAGL